jgi:hypothetical protein
MQRPNHSLLEPRTLDLWGPGNYEDCVRIWNACDLQFSIYSSVNLGKEAILEIFGQYLRFDGPPQKNYARLTGAARDISAPCTFIDYVKIGSGCAI